MKNSIHFICIWCNNRIDISKDFTDKIKPSNEGIEITCNTCGHNYFIHDGANFDGDTMNTIKL